MRIVEITAAAIVLLSASCSSIPTESPPLPEALSTTPEEEAVLDLPVIDKNAIINNGFVYFKGQTGKPVAFRAFDVTRGNIKFKKDSSTYRAYTMFVQINHGSTMSPVRFYVISENPDSRGLYFNGVIQAGGRYRPL